jgi:hypothetical protein
MICTDDPLVRAPVSEFRAREIAQVATILPKRMNAGGSGLVARVS